ncbi:Acyl carrier protein [uncultured archaeon]|nr:Acyl carrier protein [uncultured archaeon]
MEDKELFEKLERIVKESFELPKRKEITPLTLLREDLGMDSLDEYELIYEIEEEFGIVIPEDDKYLVDIETFKDLANYLKKNYKL